MRAVWAVLLCFVLAACQTTGVPKAERARAQASLAHHIQLLASDDFEGREIGSEGAHKTRRYLAETLASYGYQPGAAGGQWEQPVDLVRTEGGDGRLSIAGNPVVAGQDAVFSGGAGALAISDSKPVFYGLEASIPRDGALAGHSVVTFAQSQRAGGAQRFAGSAADVVILLTLDEETYERLAAAFKNPRWSPALEAAENQPYVLLSPEASNRLADSAGHPVDELEQRARYQPDETMPLSGEVSFTIPPQRRTAQSANIIARLPGTSSDNGAVMLMSHWDHLGRCGEEGDADRLCNGAVDNASGVGVMLETARRIAASGPLDRDLYVIGLTAEEQGLLGARALVADPPVPLPTIVAAFNIDTVAIAPRKAPVTVIGWGRTPLDKGIARVVAQAGGKLDVREEHQAFVSRQDGWALLNEGVPTVIVTGSFGDKRAFDEFMRGRYHRASDQWHEGIELGSATDDIFLHVALLKHFGSMSTYAVGED